MARRRITGSKGGSVPGRKAGGRAHRAGKRDVMLDNIEIMMSRGNDAGALRLLNKLIPKRPNSSILYVHKAGIFVGMNRLEEAEECCRKAISLDKNSSYAHGKMGLVMQMSGRADDSIPYHDRAIDLHKRSRIPDRDLARLYSNKGASLTIMDRLEDARLCFAESIKADPTYSEAYVNMGGTLYNAGRIEEAAEYFATAKKLDPDLVLHFSK